MNMQSKRGRIDRFIAKHQQMSLRAVKLAIARQQVKVDGHMIDDVQTMVDEFSLIELSGIVLQQNQPVYIVLNKPKGFVSATKDAKHPTVLSLIDHPEKSTLHIVGRLDLNSTGLLLLTNDSRWSARINDSELKVPKCYRVELKHPIQEDYVQAFEQGMFFETEQKTTQPAKLIRLSDYEAEVVLTDGMYHQIKRMFGRFRNEVVSLHRFAVGAFELDAELKTGQWRALNLDEAERLFDVRG
jgi:16S rRNA pseudouridine516 synthase